MWSSGQQWLGAWETLPGDSAPRELAFPASEVVTGFLFTTIEDLPHAREPRTSRHNGVTENKHLYFNDLEHKIIYNELRAKRGKI